MHSLVRVCLLSTFGALVSSCQAPQELSNTNAQGPCWKQEIDFETRLPFKSEADWLGVSEAWNKEVPQSVDLVRLARTYDIYIAEKKMAESLGNDKAAHCYLGCRIAQQIDEPTAFYVAWVKESWDLTDCRKETHMEPLDAVATDLGARFGSQTGNREGLCRSKCLTEYPR